AYSRPSKGAAPGGTFDLTGHISAETIVGAGISAGADYYICGPDPFMRAISAGLTAHGVPPGQVAMEIFGAKPNTAAPAGMYGDPPAPHQPAGAPGSGPPITFSRSGLTGPWDPSYGNLLDFAEASDVPVRFGCRTGVCHNCESEIVTGDVAYDITPLEP